MPRLQRTVQLGSTVEKGELNPPDARILDAVIARARRDQTAQTLTTGVLTPVQFETEDADDAGAIDLGTNATRISPPSGYTGWWLVHGGVEFTANATGYRDLAVRLNGTTIIDETYVLREVNSGSFNAYLQTATALVHLTGGTDYLELVATQTSGGNLNLVHNGTIIPFLEAIFLGA